MLTLAKRSATLRALLNQSASENKLHKAAGRVRDARIQVLRATIGSFPSVIYSRQSKTRRIAKLDEQIELLRATSPVAILTEFQLAWQKASEHF